MSITVFGALRASLVGKSGDPGDAASTVVSALTGGKVQIRKGTIGSETTVATGNVGSITVTPDDNVAISAVELTASAAIDASDTDLWAFITNAGETLGIYGPIDGSTFTLSADVALSGTVAAGSFTLPVFTTAITPTPAPAPTPTPAPTPANTAFIQPQPDIPQDILNGTRARPSNFPTNTELVIAQDANMVVPLTFLGVHTNQAIGNASGDGSPPNYGYSLVRSHDNDIDSLQDIKMSMEWWSQSSAVDSDAGYRTADLDQWFNSLEGRPALVGLYGQADWNNANPTRPSKYGSNSRLAGMAEPPIDASKYQNIAAYLRNRYPNRIRGFETGNEAKFGYNGNANPAVDTWLTNGLSAGFWHGTANQLLACKYWMKQGAGNIPIYGPGWEGGAYRTGSDSSDISDSAIQPSSRWNSVVLFHEYATFNGLGAAAICDVAASHAYNYSASYQTQQMRTLVHEARRYAKYFARTMPGKPKSCTETGFADGGGTGASVLGAVDRARYIKATSLLYALYGYSEVFWYIHSDQRALGDPANTPIVRDALQWSYDLRGAVLKDGAFLNNGSMWVRFGNGVEVTI